MPRPNYEPYKAWKHFAAIVGRALWSVSNLPQDMGTSPTGTDTYRGGEQGAMIIDVHGHFVATEVLERLRREGGTYGITVIDGPPGPCLRIGDEPLTPACFPDLHDLQRRQEHLRRTEVDLQVLSPWLE